MSLNRNNRSKHDCPDIAYYSLISLGSQYKIFVNKSHMPCQEVSSNHRFLLLILILALTEEHVGSEFLVLIACQIDLHDSFSLES